MRWLRAGVLLWSLGGCVSVDHLADTLNKRQVTSCIWGTGSYSLFFGVSLVAATGGATIEQCRQMR